MSVVAVDPQTGSLTIDGTKAFPIALAQPPPAGGTTPTNTDAWSDVANAGVNFVRTAAVAWSAAQIDGQIAAEKQVLDTVAAHGLHAWLQLGGVANLADPANQQLLDKIVNGLKGHPALGVWKGVDEPANSGVAPQGLIEAYRRLKSADPNHPVEITQAPLGTEASLEPYRPAFDITGADIYPVSYPPGIHSDLPNKDISVVGDVARKMLAAGGGKPVWMTLQIAWSGVLPNRQHPDRVPRFPTFLEERFMAYQAIVAGARGLAFFGGNLTQVMRPRDANLGWNWTFWQMVLRPLVTELASDSVRPALVAANVGAQVAANAADVQVVTRRSGTKLWVIAVRTSATATSRVTFTGLPQTTGGAHLARGEVMFEYAQRPLSPPVDPTKQAFRLVPVANDSFVDWFGPHDVHVYRFDL